jgi:hypothetical protein
MRKVRRRVRVKESMATREGRGLCSPLLTMARQEEGELKARCSQNERKRVRGGKEMKRVIFV